MSPPGVSSPQGHLPVITYPASFVSRLFCIGVAPSIRKLLWLPTPATCHKLQSTQLSPPPTFTSLLLQGESSCARVSVVVIICATSLGWDERHASKRVPKICRYETTLLVSPLGCFVA